MKSWNEDVNLFPIGCSVIVEQSRCTNDPLGLGPSDHLGLGHLRMIAE